MTLHKKQNLLQEGGMILLVIAAIALTEYFFLGTMRLPVIRSLPSATPLQETASIFASMAAI